jgi:hypothetical protein
MNIQIEEYNIKQFRTEDDFKLNQSIIQNKDLNYVWPKFPIEEKTLSTLIVYDDSTISQTQQLVNKLLFIFPNKCYYDNISMNWIKLPQDTRGYELPYLDKIFQVQKNNENNNEKSTLIIDFDNLQLENSNEYENFNILEIDSNKIVEKKEKVESMNLDFIEKIVKLYKILNNLTFITHTICIAKFKTIPKSLYEKFDIMFFTTLTISNYYSGTRTMRQFEIENLPNDRIFFTNSNLMNNNLNLYKI